MIESGPIPAIHGVVRWRAVDLCQWVFEEFRVIVAKQTLSRELRHDGLSQAVGPSRHHAQAEGAIENLKNFPARLDEIAREKGVDPASIEIWFADEARIGQKNKTTRRWAKRGTRPSAPNDQRTASTYIFGAICPKEARRRLVLPVCNIEAMNLHLAEIATEVALGALAVLLVDQAGWHIVPPPRRAAEHRPPAAAAQMSGTQPYRKHLAVHARQLAIQPGVQILRRYCRSLLRGVEQTNRSALAHHVHRHARLRARAGKFVRQTRSSINTDRGRIWRVCGSVCYLCAT